MREHSSTTNSRTTAAGARTCTWTTSRSIDSFDFGGGIIAIGNRRIADRRGELAAVLTRIPPIEMDFSSNEILAQLESIASLGYGEAPIGLSPEECLEVFRKMRDICTHAGRAPDVRLMINSFGVYRSFMDNQSSCQWDEGLRVLVLEKLSSVTSVRTPNQRATQKEMEFALVRAIRNLSREERNSRWIPETGKQENAFYRRLRELEAIELLEATSQPIATIATTEDSAAEVLGQVLAEPEDASGPISEAGSVTSTDSGSVGNSSAA